MEDAFAAEVRISEASAIAAYEYMVGFRDEEVPVIIAVAAVERPARSSYTIR